MCTLKKDEFFLCRRCKEELTLLLRTEAEPAIIADKLLKYYSVDIIILVLASNILTRNRYYKADSQLLKWAKKYENKIGFLMESISFYISPKLLEEITIIILRRFPN